MKCLQWNFVIFSPQRLFVVAKNFVADVYSKRLLIGRNWLRKFTFYEGNELKINRTQFLSSFVFCLTGTSRSFELVKGSVKSPRNNSFPVAFDRKTFPRSSFFLFWEFYDRLMIVVIFFSPMGKNLHKQYNKPTVPCTI